MTRTALITGGYSGIGYELAKLFAQDGWRLILAARDMERLEQAAAELMEDRNVSVSCFSADLAQPEGAARLWDAISKAELSVDALVNNAGFPIYGKFQDNDVARELDELQVNMVSLTVLTRLALPGMLERRWGRILNLGSTGSFVPTPRMATYCATKAYVLSFSEALGAELWGSGVSVTCLCPGATKTEFHARSGMENIRYLKGGNYASAVDVARAGYDGLMRGVPVVVPGAATKAMMFGTRFLPRRMLLRMAMNAVEEG